MRSTPIVIVGAGGFGREVLDVIDAINDASPDGERWEVLGFVDDGRPTTHGRGPILGDVADLAGIDAAFVVAIGDPALRRRVAASVSREAATLVHPDATIGADVELGPGTVVTAGVRLTNHIRVGRHVHLNLNATVGHDTRLGDFVTVYPGVSISGDVSVGEGVSLGTGSSIIQGRSIGAWTTVGAGAAVVRDLPGGVTAVGVPARVRDGGGER